VSEQSEGDEQPDPTRTAADGIDPEWLGQRVVLRYRLNPAPSSGPQQTDALGDLVGLTGTIATVDTRDGPVDVARRDVAIARLAEPSARDQLALERVAADGWRAVDVETTSDGWLLRADRGWTGRANSALALRTPTRQLGDVLAEIADWYVRRGLRPRIQVPTPAMDHLERGLAQHGWTTPETNLVLVARLDLLHDVLGPAPTANVEIAPRPDDAWLDAYEYRGDALPPHAIDVLTRHERAGFAAIRDGDGAIVANARGVVDGEYLGVTAVGVRADQRRRGQAGAIMAVLADWARDRGARRCYLQVTETNTAARALYRKLGFYQHHIYRYWFPPTIDP
jgi:ribosomal protein S18 acetylase RimI-like enzyme